MVEINCPDCNNGTPPHCGCIMKWTQESWERITIKWMESMGWKKEFDDSKIIKFTKLEDDGNLWIEDFDKETRCSTTRCANDSIVLTIVK